MKSPFRWLVFEVASFSCQQLERGICWGGGNVWVSDAKPTVPQQTSYGIYFPNYCTFPEHETELMNIYIYMCLALAIFERESDLDLKNNNNNKKKPSSSFETFSLSALGTLLRHCAHNCQIRLHRQAMLVSPVTYSLGVWEQLECLRCKESKNPCRRRWWVSVCI